MRSARSVVALLAAGLLLLAGCSADAEPEPAETTVDSAVLGGADGEEAKDPDEEPIEEPSEDATSSTLPAGQSRFPECEPGEGKTVTVLDDIVIEAQEIPGVAEDDFEFDGETVPGYAVEAAEVPERVIEQGCLIEYEAPGGCLGAMEISGAYIPAYTIPERVLPERTLPDGTVLEEIVLEAAGQDEVIVEGAYVEEVCQVEDAESSTYVSAVYRGAIYRAAGYQGASYQAAAYRSAEYLDGGTIPGTSVSGFTAEGATVSGQSIPGESLQGYLLDGTDDVEVSDTDEAVTYSSEGDVLFGNDEDELASDAEAALEAIVADIDDRGEASSIRVEGHTDDVGTEEHNLDLSERRAQAVADWLVDDGGLDRDLITTVGHGYEYPRADNDTDEGRAQNRRVVITVEIG